jgi:hypothetical protein
MLGAVIIFTLWPRVGTLMMMRTCCLHKAGEGSAPSTAACCGTACDSARQHHHHHHVTNQARQHVEVAQLRSLLAWGIPVLIIIIIIIMSRQRSQQCINAIMLESCSSPQGAAQQVTATKPTASGASQNNNAQPASICQCATARAGCST